MSRESAASLSVVPVAPLQRLAIPVDLSEAEAAIWVAVVDSKPSDWFQGDSAPLLKEYVRAVVMCDDLAANIKAATSGGRDGEEQIPLEVVGKVISQFLKLRDVESRRASALAVKLRLTQQSRYTPLSAATANKKAGAARPWLHANNAK